ncbi:MAG TPA: DUF3854 domain-containing protein [Gemmataceae bacterium]|nr:DUF3854 domain-containing protein [Gemmataceae bacterium]
MYRRLQAATTLHETNVVELLKRGFAQEEIQGRGYTTLPLAGRWKIVRQCSLGSINGLVGVPGFYFASKSGTDPHWAIAGSPGLLIPCLAPNGQIRAYRIRPDNPGEKGGKYRWLSSAGRSYGTSSGVHCHVARPLSGTASEDEIWIVEGELKADLSAQRLGAVVISIPGVTLWSRALADLAELLKDSGRVVVALDSDWRQNRLVHEAVWCLAQACPALGHEVEVALWDQQWKGLDDLLVTGQRPDLHPPNVLSEPKWPIKVSSRRLAEVSGRNPIETLRLTEMRQQIPSILAQKDASW